MLISLITAAHLAALSQIESGDRDAARGKAGETSRYQFLPALAKREISENAALRGRTFAADWEEDDRITRQIALGLWQKRVDTFRVVYHREPNLEELYLCWHRPARVLNPRPHEAERARRFEAVYRIIVNSAAAANPKS